MFHFKFIKDHWYNRFFSMVQSTKRMSQHCQQLVLISQLSSSLILQRPFLHEWDYMWGFYCSTLTRMQPRLSWTLKAASCQFVKVWKVYFSNTHVGNILCKKKSCCWGYDWNYDDGIKWYLSFLSALVLKVKSAIPGASRCFREGVKKNTFLVVFYY